MIQKARSKINQYLEQSKRKQGAVAKELGISPTTFSLFLKERYTGNNQEIAEKIEQFLGMEQRRDALSKKPDICFEVKNTRQILEKVYVTQTTGDILLIYGDAGCGKTTALQYYAQHNKNVIYVEADVTNSSCRSILKLIAEELGETSRGATSNIMQQLIKKLNGSSVVLIIDEAQHLVPKAFDAIRALNDKAGIGIVYAGNPSIKKRMYGTKQDDFDQVYSRIGYHCPLYNKYSAEDIQEIFKGYGLDKECITYLRKVAQRKGGLRIMIKQYCMAVNIALSLEEPFEIIHLQEAAERMGIWIQKENEG